MERLESRCLSMEAWERHLIFALFSQDKAGSICGLLGSVPQRQQIKHILSLMANGNARYAVQGSILRTLLPVLPYGMS